MQEIDDRDRKKDDRKQIGAKGESFVCAHLERNPNYGVAHSAHEKDGRQRGARRLLLVLLRKAKGCLCHPRAMGADIQPRNGLQDTTHSGS